jgi:hypothetical protein
MTQQDPIISCVVYWQHDIGVTRLASVDFVALPRIGEAVVAGILRDEIAAAAGMSNPLDAMVWRVTDIRHNIGDYSVSVYVVPVALQSK